MVRPILDRVLLRRIKETQEGPIVKPDAYHESMRFEVLGIGDVLILGGYRFPLIDFVNVGDIVLVHQYDIEEIPVDGETLYLTRLQNIKGIEEELNAGIGAAQRSSARVSGAGQSSWRAEQVR